MKGSFTPGVLQAALDRAIPPEADLPSPDASCSSAREGRRLLAAPRRVLLPTAKRPDTLSGDKRATGPPGPPGFPDREGRVQGADGRAAGDNYNSQRAARAGDPSSCCPVQRCRRKAHQGEIPLLSLTTLSLTPWLCRGNPSRRCRPRASPLSSRCSFNLCSLPAFRFTRPPVALTALAADFL